MKPFSRTFIDLFDAKRRYIIPMYQRQYAWKVDEQLRPLWEDIYTKVLARIERPAHTKPHFFGAVVLDQLKTFGNELPQHVVIDGQQRLTTFQLFLCAFRNVCSELGVTKYAEEIQRYLINTGIMSQPNTEKYKVWPTQRDRETFCSLLDGPSHDPTDSKPSKAIRTPEHGMRSAFEFFLQEVRKFCSEAGPDYVDPRIDALFTTLRVDLILVSIELEGDDDAQVIFETLNARGEPLSATDLLRNFVLLRAAKTGLEVETLFEKYWQPLDDPFWRKEEGRGRYKRPRIDMFFQYFLQSKTGREVNVGHIYSEYKTWSGEDLNADSVTSELREVQRYEQAFRPLITGETDSGRSEFIAWVHRLEVGTIYPLLLFLRCDSGMSQNEYDESCQILEAYLVRRLICGRDTRSYSGHFLSIIRQLRETLCSPTALKEILSKPANESVSWPTDAEFVDACMSANHRGDVDWVAAKNGASMSEIRYAATVIGFAFILTACSKSQARSSSAS